MVVCVFAVYTTKAHMDGVILFMYMYSHAYVFRYSCVMIKLTVTEDSYIPTIHYYCKNMC